MCPGRHGNKTRAQHLRESEHHDVLTSSAASYLGKSHLSLKVTSQGQPKIDEQFCQYLAGVR